MARLSFSPTCFQRTLLVSAFLILCQKETWGPPAPSQAGACYLFPKQSIPLFSICKWSVGATQVALVVKNLPANARAAGSVPGSGRSPGGGNGNPLQYFCLGNSMDRGAWQATVHRVTKSRTWLSTGACALSFTHTHTHTHTATAL